MKNMTIKVLTWILLLAIILTQNTLIQDRNLILTLTNQARAAIGVSPLVLDNSLSQAAQLHAQDMLQNNYFSHTSLNGSSPSDRAGEPVGENIASNFNLDLETLFQSWMNSPGHRANILNGTYTRLGVGVARQGARIYGVQVFGFTQSRPQTPTQTVPQQNRVVTPTVPTVPTTPTNFNINTPSNNPNTNVGTTLTQDRNLILTLTNQARAAAGINPLVLDNSLSQAAQLHAQDMIQNSYFSHTSRNGSSPSQRAGEPVGENIARNFNINLNGLFQSWMNSPGHRANILEGTYTRLGVGVARQGGRIYAVQVFGYSQGNNFQTPTQTVPQQNRAVTPTVVPTFPSGINRTQIPTDLNRNPTNINPNPTNINPNPTNINPNTPSTNQRVPIAVFPNNNSNPNTVPVQNNQNNFFGPLVNQIYGLIPGASGIIDLNTQNFLQEWINNPDGQSWPFDHLYNRGLCCMITAYKMETTLADYRNISNYNLPGGSKKVGVGITISGQTLLIWIATVL